MRRPLYRSEGISRNGSEPRAARRYPQMHRYRRLRQFVFCEARTISYVLLRRCGLSCNSAALSSLTWRYSALLLFGAQESAGADVDLKAGDRVYTTGTITGAYAELALCKNSQVQSLPARLNFSQGAGVSFPMPRRIARCFSWHALSPARRCWCMAPAVGLGGCNSVRDCGGHKDHRQCRK
jgi:hypothetical protein